MRKAPKIMLITAAALIGTGTVLSCGAWAVAGFCLLYTSPSPRDS